MFRPDGLIPLVGIGAGVIGATVLTPLLTVPILNVFGFSAAGPVAGKGQFPFDDNMYSLLNPHTPFFVAEC